MADRAIDKIRLALTHEVPADCYSTGPNLGTAQDYVCVACEALRALAALALPAEPQGDEEDLRDVIEYDRDKLWCDVLFNAEADELGPKVHTTPEGGKRIMENIISCRMSAGASATPAPMLARWPDIPKTCREPVVFMDKNLGLAMVAKWEGEQQWVFKVVNGRWVSVRMVGPLDPSMIEPLNRAAQP